MKPPLKIKIPRPMRCLMPMPQSPVRCPVQCHVSKYHTRTMFWDDDDDDNDDTNSDDDLYRDEVASKSAKGPIAHSIITTLNALVTSPRLTGTDLRQLMLNKWGKSFVVNIKRLERYYTLEISGFHLEDGSARIPEDAYILRLECICEYIQWWTLVPYVCEQIRLTKKVPTHIAGLIDSPISIPLKLIPRNSPYESEFMLPPLSSG